MQEARWGVQMKKLGLKDLERLKLKIESPEIDIYPSFSFTREGILIEDMEMLDSEPRLIPWSVVELVRIGLGR